MKTISIMQPWATLVAIGAKKIETRSWATKYRGPLAIHASKGFSGEQKRLLREKHFADVLSKAGYNRLMHNPEFYLPLGAVIATCNLVDCCKITDVGHTVGSLSAARIEGGKYGGKTDIIEGIEIIFGDYTPGRYAWILEDIKPLREPVSAKGKLGLWVWEPPEGVIL